MGTGILKITDGTPENTINLLKYGLKDWTPESPSIKNDGTWKDASMSDGRSLAVRKFGNITDTFDLAIPEHSQNRVSAEFGALFQLLEQATNYFLADWSDTPVWLEMRGDGDTNTAYALIYDYRIPNYDNPFQPPLAPINCDGTAVADDITLILEHSFWLAKPPGQSQCVPMACDQPTIEIGDVAAQNDDAYVFTAGLGSIQLATVSMFVGLAPIDACHAGMRFPVSIPAGATIVSAFLGLYAEITSSGGPNCKFIIKGESNIAPAQFSTYANFMGRVRTTAEVEWNNVPVTAAGGTYTSPNIASVVQEMLDLPGGPGATMVIFIEDNGTTVANNLHQFSSVDSVTYPTPRLQIAWTVPTAPSCNEILIPNTGLKVSITDAYWHDISAVAPNDWSANLIGAAKPTSLLTPLAAPAIGDEFYVGVANTAGIFAFFDNVIFNLSQQTDALGQWEYSQGAGVWGVVIATPTFFAVDYGIGFALGLNRSALWASDAVNGVTGYWLRFVVTVAGTVEPQQTTPEIYTVTNPKIKILASAVTGETTAPIRVTVVNSTAVNTPENIYRVLVASRSIDRGVDYTPYIPFSDLQFVEGTTVTTLGAISTMQNSYIHAMSRGIRVRPVGVLAAQTAVASIAMDREIAQQYRGWFAPKIRVRQVGGVRGDFTMQLYLYSAGNIELWRSDVKTSWADNQILEFGQVELPPSSYLFSNNSLSGLVWYVTITNSNAVPGDLWLQDLILWPLDEFSGEYSSQLPTVARSSAGISLTDLSIRFLDVDSVTYPKDQVVALLKTYPSTEDFIMRWVENTPGPAFLQNDRDQYLFVLGIGNEEGGTYEQESVFKVLMKVQTYCNPRYFMTRGDR